MTILSFISIYNSAHAEPWLGSRFAQNCSGCHAPGRINLPAKDRRCSLSCQGCHVNPNGGGLRSFYGKWNEQRWLRSFASERLSHKKQPRPYPTQTYGKELKDPTHGLSDKINSEKLIVAELGEEQDENLFDRRDRREFINSKDHDEFLASIPDDDPYRELFLNRTDGGAALRLISYQSEQNGVKDRKSFLMNIDLAFRYRPFYRQLHLVHETRFLGRTTQTNLDAMVQHPLTRSSYLLIDDLPFNIFVMGGYYQPLIGHYVPDHTLLSQRMLSSALSGHPQGAYNLLFKAYSIGTAPNVPYANLHRIQDRMYRSEGTAPVQGWAANIGLRFVTIGASINYSVWSTQQGVSTKQQLLATDFKNKTLIQSLNLTSTWFYNRFYLGLDAISLEQDELLRYKRAGIYSLEAKLRIWREIYVNSALSTANADDQLEIGYAKQWLIGLQSFLYPGIQWSISHSKEVQGSQTKAPSEKETLQSQIHIYI